MKILIIILLTGLPLCFGNEYILIEGDIMVEKDFNKSDKGGSRRWPFFKRWEGKTIPYVLHGSIPNKGRILMAIEHYHQHTPFKFVERTDEKNYIRFIQNNKGCSSWIGRKGKRQDINVADWCTRGTLIHEIGHALGLIHEHTRCDRNKYIKILWDNIKKNGKDNYYRWPFIGRKLGEFDFDSIMLYPSRTIWAKDPDKPTMVRRDGTEFTAQRDNLSNGDLRSLAKLYRYDEEE